ncbi:hypothetical protein IRJ41_008603 [Triplophysa rosa]|uniref:Reverse transcriptase RNase H-like domain-containing protein n=1 Tax=Triplophysa rosa TaxID=992332 RepID=A0A9W7T2U5_TRIRA|nr:hypothetical protein IRJ41_008603 [Triplophysa rosa]
MSHHDGNENAAASGAANVGTTCAATVKLPDFWQHNPRPLFQHIEAQFQLRGITQDVTKFSTAMALLKAPLVDGKYDALKTFLLKLFELSELEKADRLLSLNGLGDSKPSELMEWMLAVLGAADPSFLFAHIFLRQLPVPVRTALASSPLPSSRDYRALAVEVDRIFLANRQQFVHALLPPSTPAVTARRQREDGWYYHSRFGAKAKQCRQLCTMGAGRDCKLLFITDTLSGRRLLVDSGAQRSILPVMTVDTMAGGHGPPMDAANGTPIRTYGTRYVEVCFGGRRFGWDFVMAAVSTSLLGADFLCTYRLLVDVTNCRLIDALSFALYPCTLGGVGVLCLSNTLATGDLYQRLLAEFPDITTPTFSSAVAYRKLRDNERKYSSFDRELLGLFLATRHFRFLLEGRLFTAFVDHKPLTFAMAKSSEPWSGQQQRQLSAISEFTTDIQHVAGKDNFVADCLSRVVAGSVHLGLYYATMAVDQNADAEVQAYRTAPTALLMEDVVFDTANATLLCDVSTGQPRPMVPADWRRKDWRRF